MSMRYERHIFFINSKDYWESHKQKFLKWLEASRNERATHVLIVLDSHNGTVYPVKVASGEDPKEKEAGTNKNKFQNVVSVYNLSLDLTAQLSAGLYVFNY
ncbi:MAG: hypothetical protein ACM3KR_11115 [Deltaproteobacteria bacterium]